MQQQNVPGPTLMLFNALFSDIFTSLFILVSSIEQQKTHSPNSRTNPTIHGQPKFIYGCGEKTLCEGPVVGR